ncbi:twin-arginine translocation signal domain-containing protein [Shewanella halotolerans]|uniref:twin-arginine translocation signal domain-containing protein n=1 Tax=Shewanella halotolerans TaxID=2864204 RepID=UPI001C659085|nr:twin-arginine translocation signal domain-containing protein [Shewanella halotolerans]QYJ90595.1 twin-arginine translocation signal domain-containing protein [Shewanella halotolerans]
MNRRTFLTTALVGTGALALGVNLYHPPQVRVSASLDQSHRLLFSLLVPVFLDGALPHTQSLRVAAQNRTLDAIVATMDLLPEESRDELEQLLELLESRLGLLLLTGNMTPLLMRQPQELAAMLEAWRTSFLDLMVTAYQGLRELVLASYYSCPEHWTRLNYEKPRLFN